MESYSVSLSEYNLGAEAYKNNINIEREEESNSRESPSTNSYDPEILKSSATSSNSNRETSL